MSIKIERLANAFTKEIGHILKNEIKDENIKFVTITATEIASDLSLAKVYFTVLDNNNKINTLNSLNKASRFIRKELCSRVDIRKMPELIFIYDESIEYGNRIEKIISELND